MERQMITKIRLCVNQFKFFDGANGQPPNGFRGGRARSTADWMRRNSPDQRKIRHGKTRDIYSSKNLTSGTYPIPILAAYADSTWYRWGGRDNDVGWLSDQTGGGALA